MHYQKAVIQDDLTYNLAHRIRKFLKVVADGITIVTIARDECEIHVFVG